MAKHGTTPNPAFLKKGTKQANAGNKKAGAVAKRGRPMKMIPAPAVQLDINSKYHEALAYTLFRIGEEQTAALRATTGDRTQRAHAFHMSGHLYDRIILDIGVQGKTRGNARVYAFVERATGTIYGRKTDSVPHPKAYFGTVYESANWRWSGIIPEPISLEAANVHVIGKHGQYVYHAPGPEPTGEEDDEDTGNGIEGGEEDDENDDEAADDDTDDDSGGIEGSGNDISDDNISTDEGTDDDWTKMEPIGTVVSGPPPGAEVDDEPEVKEGDIISDPNMYAIPEDEPASDDVTGDTPADEKPDTEG